MESQRGNIMTLSNSIIGVSILAMPFCFKQCGIILAVCMLITSSVLTRLTCHFLLKSSTMARRRTFELLAFHAFGTTGKFVVELGIIGFLMGTCIAFFVIIGDLGPAIIAKMLDMKPTDTLRTSILIGVALFCVMPLGLLKNVDSLHSVSTATIGFYFCLVLKTISEAASHFMSGDWMSKVELWRPVGILQCLPIFAMALSCQTQLFEIYEIVANPTLEKMNHIVHMAVNICVAVYVCVGFFGYVAFASQNFTGNILMSFSPSMMTDVMKIGFVLSVAFSFPLVIFPCRASLHSLLFKKGYTPYEGTSNYIPESKFKVITLFIVSVSLTIGILIPNIEVVLGLVGSTIGTMICLIFPVTCFICISTKNTNERLVAQILLFVGVIVMVMGTYANLYAMEEISSNAITEKSVILPNPVLEVQGIEKIEPINKFQAIESIQQNKPIEKKPIQQPQRVLVPLETKMDMRLEPPQPVEPQDEAPSKTDKPPDKKQENPPLIEHQTEINIDKTVPKETKRKSDDPKLNEVNDNKKALEEVDIEAIKKEDTELQEEEKNKQGELDERKILLKTLQKQNEENVRLLEEIKKKEQSENEAKHIAAKQIMEVAKKAIEKLNVGKINGTSLFNNINPKSTVNTGIRKDPIASKILKLSNTDNKPTKNIETNNIPPLPIIKSKIYKKSMMETLESNGKIVKLGAQSPNQSEINTDIKGKELLKSLVENRIVTTLKPLETKNIESQIDEKLVKSVQTETKEKQETKIEPPVKPGKLDEKVTVLKNDAKENEPARTELSINSAKRDILMENENTENIRMKRESITEEIVKETIVINDEKCEREENTEKPLLNLITQLSKQDVFRMETNFVENLRNEIKSKSMHLKKK